MGNDVKAGRMTYFVWAGVMAAMSFGFALACAWADRLKDWWSTPVDLYALILAIATGLAVFGLVCRGIAGSFDTPSPLDRERR
jgi:hypothetical protein